MSVSACATPAESLLSTGRVARADFRDAWRAPISQPDLSTSDIYYGIFSHRPAWMNAILIARNAAASVIGLEAPTASEVLTPERRPHHVVGEKIGLWPLFHLDEHELVAGRNNTHMDFRVSVLKVAVGKDVDVVVSTVCWVKNRFGRRYLSTIIPFHTWGLRKLIAEAVSARRI